jgi:cyanophycin synthetase
VIDLNDLPFTGKGRFQFQVQNAVAAAAAAWAAGLSPDTIEEGLNAIDNGITTIPGRFNMINHEGVQVIIDYGHNAAALEALGQAIDALGPRRTTMLIGLPGDRRDEDIRSAIEATRYYVDEYLVMDHGNRRGRKKREIFDLIRRHLPETVPCTYGGSQEESLTMALQQAHSGERLIVIADEIDSVFDTLRQIEMSKRNVKCQIGRLSS